ncbi:hypothetical protein [Litorilituus lipolyticus]|uniref:Uncharacterized protein n=1 Tax=Litorilituus lipolyticus TaxID=2491017 RepID=A0A502LDD6_9GAMM|nr:hypothetical protein [Litorilituus lipolyticus]TPH18127.1 hypothetical protein EPA86_03165 [Litorilituus lipolyticus]
MNLFNSILTSIVIVVIFWACAFFQTSIAHAIQHKEVGASLELSKKANAEKVKVHKTALDNAELVNESITKIINFSGIKQRIYLEDTPQLWQRFNSDTKIHKLLKQQPKQIFVTYSALSKDFKQADVAIGYNVIELSKFDSHHTIEMHRLKRLLAKGKYSDSALTDAWKSIDYNKAIDYVLEVHDLSNGTDIESTQLFVAYK